MRSSDPSPFPSSYTALSPRLRNHVQGAHSHSPTTHITVHQSDPPAPLASASLKSHFNPLTSPLPSKSSSSASPNIAVPPSVTPIFSASPLSAAPISNTSPPSSTPSSPSPSQPSSSQPRIIGPPHNSLLPPPVPSLRAPPSIIKSIPVNAPSPLPHVQITSPLPPVPKPRTTSKPHTPSTTFWHPRSSAPSVPDSPVQTPHQVPFTRPFTPSSKPFFPSQNPPSELSFPPAEPSLKSTPKSYKSPGGISSGPVVFALVVAGVIIFSVVGFVIWSIKMKKRIHHGDNYFGLFSGSFYYKSGQSSVRPSQQPQTPLRDYQNGYKGYSESIAGGTLGVPQPLNASSMYGWGNSKFAFSYEQLVVATNGFSIENQLGEGRFGWVYRGQLPDGQVVAVKQLKVGGGQGEHEFQVEVEIIGRVHHRNLVSLVGYCITDGQRLLSYEYVPNGNLEQHLHGKGRLVMDWATRNKIAIGSARGLAYLHEDCHPRIIHQDIKSSNVLLDNNFEARVSDFGLAKLAPDTYTHGTTPAAGTFGYLAPEYASSGKLTERSDVYSFGVLLLELVTGRRPVVTSQSVGNESLVEWARPLLNHALEDRNLEGIADPKLGNNYDRAEMFRMLQAAAACVRHSAQRRPCMRQVARALESDGGHYDLSNGVKPGHSADYSTDNSAFIRRIRMMAFGNQEYGTYDYSISSTSEYGLSHSVSSSNLANGNITEGKSSRYEKAGTGSPSFG